MTHELCGCLLTSDPSLLVSSVTDVPLYCKYTLNTHIPTVVSFIQLFYWGYLKGVVQLKHTLKLDLQTQFLLILQGDQTGGHT